MRQKKPYPDPFYLEDNGKYYFWFWNKKTGKRQKKSTGFGMGKKGAARHFIKDFIDSLESAAVDLTFEEYSRKYFVWETCPRVQRLLNEGKSIGKKYVGDNRRWLNNFVYKDPIFPQLKMNEIRRSDVLDLRERMKKKTSLYSVNRIITAIKSIFSEAYFREEIDRDPGHRVGAIKIQKKERGIFHPIDIKNLFGQYSPWKKKLPYTAFYTAAFTGMRSGEVRALKWDCIDLEEKTINIIRAWKTKDELGPPKWNKTREIKISDSLVNVLRDWKEYTLHSKQNDFVFCTLTGIPLGATWWKKHFNLPVEKIIPDWLQRKLTPHSFRHGLNTNLLIAGCDPLLVQKYLGWSNNYIKMLVPVQAGYTHIQAESLEKVARMIDEIYT